MSNLQTINVVVVRKVKKSKFSSSKVEALLWEVNNREDVILCQYCMENGTERCMECIYLFGYYFICRMAEKDENVASEV